MLLHRLSKISMRFVIVSIISGTLFGLFDIAINANSYAQKLLDVYKPIANTSVNIPLGIIIDLLYGFVMAGLFLLLYKSLPGKNGLMKGISYGLIVWFFRVLMYVFSQFMAINMAINTVLYILFTGLIEILMIGIFYGLFLKPKEVK